VLRGRSRGRLRLARYPHGRSENWLLEPSHAKTGVRVASGAPNNRKHLEAHDGPIAQRTLLRAVQIGCAMALCASSTMRVMTVCAWSRRSRHKALFRPTSPQASLPVAEQFLLPGTGHRDWSFHRHGDFRWKCRRGGGCYWHGHDPRHRWHSRWLHPCRCGADYSTRDGAYDGVTVIGCGGGFNTGGLTRPRPAVIRGGTPD
jgi:hypothetical protein